MKTMLDVEMAQRLAPLGDAINRYVAYEYNRTAQPPEDMCLKMMTPSGYAYLRFVAGAEPEPPLPAQRKGVGWYMTCDVWVGNKWVTQHPVLWDDNDKRAWESRHCKDDPTLRNVKISEVWVEA